MAAVQRQFSDPRDIWRDQCWPAFRDFRAGNLSAAVKLLKALLREQPENGRIYRLIGLAHLAQGRPRAARKHLERALRLLRREQAGSGSLQHALQAQLERAMLRYALLSLCVRLGRPKDARMLAAEEGWDL
ncbi:MAG: tetratricopeptide repeat protein [Candidatus Rokubacteria bacterium]|nr:tetratricopeptide repeat protein [Candidatus Rokubacteria bacterium]